MLQGKLLHPEILSTLGSAGHGARILIVDSNYPYSTGAAPGVPRVYLNLSPGIVSVTDVLHALVSVTPVEAVTVMVHSDGTDPAVCEDLLQCFGPDFHLTRLGRFEFYDNARGRDTALLIATGDLRFANLFLTIGAKRS